MIPHLGQCLIFAATEAEANATIVPNWVKILITVGVFLVPYGLGVLIARSLKLREYAFRLTLVLFAAALGLMPFAYQAILGLLERQHYDRQLAEYEAKRNEFKITSDDLDTLQQAYPRLKIDRPLDAAKPPEISPVGEAD